MSLKPSFRHALVTTVALAMLTPTAAAQTADANEDHDIVVTGQREQYVAAGPTIEVPASIQTLSAATLRQAGITRLDQALELAPGIARQNPFGGLFDSFACRGFVGDENLGSNYLVNGFNAARGYGGPRDMANVERITVLKGPQSALFGRGEPGCTINITTKAPHFHPHASAILSAGSFATLRSEGDVNVPLSDTIALRITGAAEASDGFRNTIRSHRYTVTPSLLVRLSPDTWLTYQLEYIRQSAPFDRGVVTVDGKLDTVPRDRFLGEPGDGPVRVRALGHQAQLQHDFDGDWSVILGAGYRDTRFVGYSSEAELAAGRQKLFTDGRTLSRIRRYRDYATSDLTLRGELSGTFATAGLAHHLILGADWDDFLLTTLQGRYRPPAVAAQRTPAIANSVDIFAPTYGKLPATPIFQDLRERQYSYGLYAQDQIDLTRQLTLRAGARFDSFEQTVDNHIARNRVGQQRQVVSPQVGLSFAPSDMLSFYVNYGRGFRPNTGTSFTGQPFDPERTTSYEVGTKLALFDGRLTGTLAAFRATKSNVLSTDPVNSGFMLAVGRARSRGVEFDMSGTLPGAVRVQLAYAYIDAGIAADALDANFGLALRRGDPLLGIARHSGSALLFKDFDLAGRKATLGAGVSYVGRRLGETGFRFADGRFFELPAYTLTRLVGSIDATRTLRLSGEVTNLFDTTYYPNAYSRLWVVPGAPRQVMLRAAYRL